MGTRADDAGISVQVYDGQDEPVGPPFHGEHVRLFGRARHAVVTDQDPPTVAEFKNPGSLDWLTLVVVADTQQGLDGFLATRNEQSHGIPGTSASSHRATVAIIRNGQAEVLERRITLASGPITSLSPNAPTMDVVHVKVLAPDVVMDESHKFFAEFTGGSPFFSAAPAPTRAT